MAGLSAPVAVGDVPDVSGADAERSDVASKATPRAPRGVTDTDELVEACRRILGALSRRVGEGDMEDLRRLVMLRVDVERCIIGAVAGLRADPDLPASWSDIGRALGVGREAAYKRYGAAADQAGLRRPGGQPAGWR
jgi:hypothetical protein